MRPYYEDDLVTIYHGDFREFDPVTPPAGPRPQDGQTSLEWDRWVHFWPVRIRASSMWVFGTLRMFMDHAAEFAARDAGRRAIGIDIREDQCEIAAKRCRWLVAA